MAGALAIDWSCKPGAVQREEPTAGPTEDRIILLGVGLPLDQRHLLDSALEDETPAGEPRDDVAERGRLVGGFAPESG